MFQSLRNDCGAKAIHQSHTNILPTRSLDMFNIMGNNRDILSQYTREKKPITEVVQDTYIAGIHKMKQMICKDGDLAKFKKHIHAQHHKHVSSTEQPEHPSADLGMESGGEASGSEEM
jgi:hypothetical protein